MAKMTNAQARKQLTAAQRKIDSVAFGDAARFLSSAQRGKLYAMSNQLIAMVKALK